MSGAVPLSNDELRQQIFCRDTVAAGGESYNIVAYLNAYEPGAIYVGVNDDNDCPDSRFPVTSVNMQVAMQFRRQRGEYPWEVLMREAEQKLLEVANG